MITWGPDTKSLQNWSLSQPTLPVPSPAGVLSKSEGNLEGVGCGGKWSEGVSFNPGTNCSIHARAHNFPGNFPIVNCLKNFDKRILGKLCLNNVPADSPF